MADLPARRRARSWRKKDSSPCGSRSRMTDSWCEGPRTCTVTPERARGRKVCRALVGGRKRRRGSPAKPSWRVFIATGLRRQLRARMVACGSSSRAERTSVSNSATSPWRSRMLVATGSPTCSVQGIQTSCTSTSRQRGLSKPETWSWWRWEATTTWMRGTPSGSRTDSRMWSIDRLERVLALAVEVHPAVDQHLARTAAAGKEEQEGVPQADVVHPHHHRRRGRGGGLTAPHPPCRRLRLRRPRARL